LNPLQKVKEFAMERKTLCIRAAVALAVVLAMMGVMAVTVFAESTYVINDGGSQVIYKTDATEPTDVLEQAGLELSAGDQITTEEYLGGATITIRRAVLLGNAWMAEPASQASPAAVPVPWASSRPMVSMSTPLF